MKSYLFFWVTLFSLSLASCYQPERDCTNFKTGTFTFEYDVNGEKKRSEFTRNDKFSIEYYENKIDTAAVRWLNNCEFMLTPSDKQTPIHYKILSTTNNSYTFEYNVVGKSIKSKGTAIKTN